MTRGAAFLLALGIALAAVLHGGIWEYGDGFLFNRFTGGIIYVRLPEGDSIDHTRGFAAPRTVPERSAGYVADRGPGGQP